MVLSFLCASSIGKRRINEIYSGLAVRPKLIVMIQMGVIRMLLRVAYGCEKKKLKIKKNFYKDIRNFRSSLKF